MRIHPRLITHARVHACLLIPLMALLAILAFGASSASAAEPW